MNTEKLNELSVAELQNTKERIKIDMERSNACLECVKSLSRVIETVNTGRLYEVMEEAHLLHNEETLQNLGTINRLRAHFLSGIDELSTFAKAIINAPVKWIEEQERYITLIDQIIIEKQKAQGNTFATIVRTGNKREIIKRLRTLLDAELKPTKKVLMLLVCVKLNILSTPPTFKQFRAEFGNDTINENTYRKYIKKGMAEFDQRDIKNVECKLSITFAPIIYK